MMQRPLLLAPAGSVEAGVAAFQYGADAVYLGLRQFSARAEAANFTFSELDGFVGWAHSLTPRRRVYVALNTLIADDELPGMVDTLLRLKRIVPDALIVQDLGLLRLARDLVPEIELHASTQMTLHNPAGVAELARHGAALVTLARELTLDEVRACAATGVPVEVFVHGALCYSYSGLCLYSSLTANRSGNRGACAQPCRYPHRVEESGEDLLPFSMHDLALGARVLELAEAGVACLKIEGRMKSPLYVAAVTKFYRDILDGNLEGEALRQRALDLRTIFSRPPTLHSFEKPAHAGLVDPHWTGHRGRRLATALQVERRRNGEFLRLKLEHALERHDGLQLDLPGSERPYGFAVSDLYQMERGRPQMVFEAPTGAVVEVLLPEEHPPIQPGQEVRLASSLAVKRQYPVEMPRLELHAGRVPLDVTVRIEATRISATGTVAGTVVGGEAEEAGEFAPARDTAKIAGAVSSAFERLGETPFRLRDLQVQNPEGRFAPASILNRLRRDLCERLQTQLEEEHRRQVTEAVRKLRWEVALEGRQAEERVPASPVAVTPAAGAESVAPKARWSVLTDRLAHLQAFEADDWIGVEEAVVDVGSEPWDDLLAGLERLDGEIGRARIRLALPVLARAWEWSELQRRAQALLDAGWARWMIGNPGGMGLLGGVRESLDLVADWPLYVWNRLAVEELAAWGFQRMTLGPELDLSACRRLLQGHTERLTVVVHQDPPLFLSESCAHANTAGGCRGGEGCAEPLTLENRFGDRVQAFTRGCRTVALPEHPLTQETWLPELLHAGVQHLRADFVWRPYDPVEAAAAWRQLRQRMD